MTRSRATAALIGALVVAMSATLPAGVLASAQMPPAPQERVAEPPPVARPDIIVVYVDDVPPLDGRLWSADRTPAIRHWIIDRGLTFTNAIGESPLCCPARANLLTGLHTHNHGVTRNEASLFDPTVTIASELRDVGYRTAWIGKYLNRYMSMRGAARLAHEAAWDTFQPMSGGGHGYYWWPKGERRYSRPTVHSMHLVQELAVAELRGVPVSTPLFAVLSTYAGHRPSQPMDEWHGSTRCAHIPRWRPPNHGARANTGKPDWLRRWAVHQRPRVSPQGFPLVRVCEDMLGVDQLVGKVVREQSARGRLDDTLLVLTSDNGVLFGEYGLLGKQVPWSVPVPLVMSWPRAMGTSARTTDAPTSNIDLAPTFCAIAGCRMGPFPSGQASADGTSLVPVMLRDAVSTRTALLSSMLHGNPISDMPAWTAVTTYAGHPLGRWHYIRWQTGRRELYDLAADPWELHDRSQDPAYASVRQALERLRRQLLAEGRRLPARPPDAGTTERVR